MRLPFNHLPLPPLSPSLDLCNDFLSLSLNRKGRRFLDVGLNWKKSYLELQPQIKDAPKYNVETELDRRIPFLPDAVEDYFLIAPRLFSLARRFALACEPFEVVQICACFKETTSEAAAVFQEFPTFMPRPLNHHNSTLKFIQYFDAPVNCCPSLHVAYSTLAYNIGRNILPPDEFQPFEETIGAMTASVAYTKQHALIDIVYGKVLSQIVFQNHFSGSYFDAFPEKKKNLSKEISSYLELKVNEELHKINRGTSFFDAVKTELTSGRYELLPPERCRC